MSHDVIIVGSGIAGLSAAIPASAAGLRVLVLEAAERWGGKAGIASVDGVEFDTGPSLLTLPDVFDEIFRAAGSSLAEEVRLIRPDPAFRYLFHSGAQLDISVEREETAARIGALWGERARDEFESYLSDAERIWQAARPHFVEGPAPNWATILRGGPSALFALGKIDAFRSLEEGIRRRVKTPELVQLFARFATYNGSDMRTAPATLGCIAHVELNLGGWGVEGGIFRLVEALGQCAMRLGVEFEWNARVEELLLERGRVQGVRVRGGQRRASSVLVNADVRHLLEELLPEGATTLSLEKTVPSMSAYNAVYRAARGGEVSTRPAHAVVFPEDYAAEFADIFEKNRPPRTPAVYVCAQEVAQKRVGWPEQEPLFVMANCPAVQEDYEEALVAELAEKVERKLRSVGWLLDTDERVWSRTPRQLAERFPGSRGALYGAASNDKWSAFRRAPQEVTELPGLYLASGSVHPGGGLPLVARSGQQAARALVRNTERSKGGVK